MEREKLTAAGAAEVRHINELWPGLQWKNCRICGGYAPSNLGVGNRHVTCQDTEKAKATRINKKAINPDQAVMF